MNNWIVGTLQSAFDTWNEKLTEIWSLVTTTPQAFRGGEIWNTIVSINDGLKAFGYGLLVLFFAMSVFRSAASFRDLQRPEFALRHFIRFLLAKVAVGSAMELMTSVFAVCGGVVQTIMSSIGGMSAASVTLPQEIIDAIEEVGFLQSIPLWLVTFFGSLLITALSFVLIMTVYGSAAASILRGRRYKFYGESLSEKLHRRLHGGCCRGAGLSDFFGICLQRRTHSRHLSARCYDELAICSADHIQYAGAGGPCERRGAHRKGDVRIIRQEKAGRSPLFSFLIFCDGDTVFHLKAGDGTPLHSCAV